MPVGDRGPTKKDVVVALMEMQGRDDPTTTTPAFVAYRCPRPGCRNPSVRFRSGTGYSNPYRHLRACYARGKPENEQIAVLNCLYAEAVKARDYHGGSILSHFSIRALTEMDKAVFGYLRLIVMRSLPVTIVEDEEYRRFTKHGQKISYRMIVSVILRLVELVEKRVSIELQGTQGAVMFDGWVGNSTHYVNVIASYCIDAPKKTNSGTVLESMTRSTLLGISSLGQIETGNEGPDESSGAESTKFSAEVHIEYFREAFKFHNLDFDKWCVCLLGDNASVNLRMSRLINKPFVGCSNHKLNLDVNDMVRNSRDLSATIDNVHNIMKHVKSRLKNSAKLRNLTNLRPVIHNETRWSGKHAMLKRFCEIKEELVQVCDEDNVNLPDILEGSLTRKAARYERMLGAINVVQVKMQKKMCSLSFCRDAMDTLIEAINEEKVYRGSVLFACTLTAAHIAPDARCVKYPAFESAIVKIQKGYEESLTKTEQESVSSLLLSPADNDVEESLSRTLTIEERLAKRQRVCKTSAYINCNFVLGSVAEAERVWSICKYVLSDHRSSLTPQLFEALIYLRYNERFWDPQLVAEAVSSARGARS